jgi:putative aldouronate transport system substrate-binding protein
MKKLICFLLATVLILSFAACTKTEQNPNETGSKTTSSTGTTTKGTTLETTTTVVEENPFEEFMEISWITQLNTDWQDGRWDELELEEMFNVDLQVWARDSLNDKEGMAALVASGDVPDFMFMPGGPRQPADMLKEGLTRSIPLSFFQKYLPGYYELLQKMPIGFKYNLVEGTTDEYLGITHIGFASAQYFYDATIINLDWLEAIGYEMDMSQLKPVKMITEGFDQFNDNLFVGEGNFTFEEFNDILRKFTEDDPDGNGEDDTYGMMYLPESAWTNMTQEGLFGFVYDLNYLYEDPITGDIVPKVAYTPYRDYLAWISDNLNKGYIRRLPGQAGWVAEYQQLSSTNKMGIFQGHRDGYLQLTNDIYRNYPPQNILLGVDENARFVMGPMFRGPEGKLVDMTYSIDTFGVGLSRTEMIGAQVSDAKLERILRMLQYMIYTEEDIFYRYHYGIEGIHWKWAGEPYKSTMIITPQADLEPQYRGNVRPFTCWLMQWPTAQREIDAAVNDGYWSVPAYMYANNLYKKYTELKAELDPQMNPIINDFKNRALNGQIADFNSEWSQYIDQLYDAGLQKLIDEVYSVEEYEFFERGEVFKIMAPLY